MRDVFSIISKCCQAPGPGLDQPGPWGMKSKIFARMALNHPLTLTLGCKNEKRPSGPIELDLEAGNLVYFQGKNILP